MSEPRHANGHATSAEARKAARNGRLDGLDLSIVELLRSDGRIPTVEIARQLGVSEGTVRKRMQRLERDNVIQVVATSSIHLLGYRHEMKVQLKTVPSQTRAVIDALKAMKRVRYVALVAGSFNIDMTVAFESDRAAATFFVDELAAITGIIEVNSAPLLRVVKRSYDWLAADGDFIETDDTKA